MAPRLGTVSADGPAKNCVFVPSLGREGVVRWGGGCYKLWGQSLFDLGRRRKPKTVSDWGKKGRKITLVWLLLSLSGWYSLLIKMLVLHIDCSFFQILEEDPKNSMDSETKIDSFHPFRDISPLSRNLNIFQVYSNSSTH